MPYAFFILQVNIVSICRANFISVIHCKILKATTGKFTIKGKYGECGSLLGIAAGDNCGKKIWGRIAYAIFHGENGRSLLESYLKALDLGEPGAAADGESFLVLFNSARIGFFLLDPGGKIAVINPVIKEILGRDADEILGWPVDKVFYADKGAAPLIISAIQSEKRDSLFEDRRGVREDGTAFWGQLRVTPIRDAEGAVKAFMGIMLDITDRKNAEIVLQNSKERYRSALEKSGASSIIIEEDMIISMANPKYEQMTGYRRDEMDKNGYLDLANGGTLFLDELGEFGLNMQVKLLRAIEGGGYTPVGGGKEKRPDIRIIAATNRNLLDQVKNGLMRKDFFYRIHIVPIHLPLLKDRKEDLPLLVEHFMGLYGGRDNLPPISGDILEAIRKYDWPGNVRELQNTLHRYVTLKKFDVDDTALTGSHEPEIVDPDNSHEIQDIRAALRDFEKNYILNALEMSQWHRGKAASALGINRRTLFKKTKQYGIDPAQYGNK